MKRILAVAALVILAGCVPPVARIAVTQSGKPEVTINVDLARIKAAIAGRVANGGFVIEQDSDYMLRASKPLDGNENLWASMAIGNAYSTNRGVVIYTFAKTDGGYRVIVSASWTAQMPGGQVSTMDQTANNGVFNQVQSGLIAMKDELER